MSDNLLEKVNSLVDASRSLLISRLSEAVSIQSVSADLTRRNESVRMAEWTKKHLERLGASCELCPLPSSALILPPVLFGSLGTDPNKKTLLVYCHLDVQPAKKEDGWTSDPFVLTEVDGELIGRGASDDKAPVISWITAIESMQQVGLAIPVNLKFVFEGMEESGSAGLEDLLRKRTDFMAGIDYVCVSDDEWLDKVKPSITYGLRGLGYFSATVSQSSSDLKSVGKEPLTDLLWLMSQLITDDGKPNIPKLAEMVPKVSEKELKKYENIEFDVQQYKRDLGVSLYTEDKMALLMRQWRYPSLSLHGIEGAFSDAGASMVIPSSVTGKFSIRTVPDMQIELVEKAVVEHLDNLWKARNTPNKLKAKLLHSGRWWLADTDDSVNHRAAERAIQKVFGVFPDYVRVGGPVPITGIFQEITGVPVLQLANCTTHDKAHGQNESMNVRNLVEGTKMFAAYLVELGKI